MSLRLVQSIENNHVLITLHAKSAVVKLPYDAVERSFNTSNVSSEVFPYLKFLKDAGER